jgi:hypothetical protein
MSREDDDEQAGQTLSAQCSSAATESEPSPETEASVRALDSGGEPLKPALRSFFEPRFGHSWETASGASLGVLWDITHDRPLG